MPSAPPRKSCGLRCAEIAARSAAPYEHQDIHLLDCVLVNSIIGTKHAAQHPAQRELWA